MALEERVVEWSRNELGCPLRISPPLLGPLCQGAQAEEVWTYLMNRVKSPAKIEKIKATLSLQQQHPHSKDETALKRERLLARKRELEERITECDSEEQKIQRNLDSLKCSLSREEKKTKEEKERMMEEKIRLHLLRKHTVKTSHSLLQTQEYSRRIDSTLSSGGGKKMDQEEQSQKKFYVSSQQGEQVVVESEEERIVRHAVSDSVSLMMEDIFSPKEESQTKGSILQEERERGRNRGHRGNGGVKKFGEEVEKHSKMESHQEVFKSVSPEALTNWLSSSAFLETKKISLSTSPDKESENHFPSKGTRVEDEIQEKYEQQIQFFLETQRIENKAISYHQQVEELWKENLNLQEKALDSLDGREGPNHQQEILKAHYQLLNLKVQKDVEKQRLKSLESYILQIQKEIRERKREVRMVRQKHQLIFSQNQERDRRKKIIERIVQENSQFFIYLQKKRERVLKLGENYIKSLVLQLESLGAAMKNLVHNEVSLFFQLPLHLVCWTSIISSNRSEKLLTSKLTIHEKYEREDVVNEILSSLGACFHLSSDAILVQLAHLKFSIYISTTQLQRFSLTQIKEITFGSSNGKKYLDLNFWKTLQQNGEKVSQSYSSILLPKLHNSLKALKELNESIKTLQRLLQDWWEQPGQYTAPFVKVDGKNFDDWVSCWKEVSHEKFE